MFAGATTTKFLESLPFSPKAIEVVHPGMNTTIQARPFAKAVVTLIYHHDAQLRRTARDTHSCSMLDFPRLAH